MTDIDPDIDEIVKNLTLTPEQQKSISTLVVKKIDDIIAEKIGKEFNIENVRNIKKELQELKTYFEVKTKNTGKDDAT